MCGADGVKIVNNVARFEFFGTRFSINSRRWEECLGRDSKIEGVILTQYETINYDPVLDIVIFATGG